MDKLQEAYQNIVENEKTNPVMVTTKKDKILKEIREMKEEFDKRLNRLVEML